MSVVGIDLGNMNTVIAVARNRGVDIVCNEVSNRSTPTLVGFADRRRLLGEAAKTMEISNLKNTVANIKRFIGRSFMEAEIQDVEKQYATCELVSHEGQIGAVVDCLGEKKTFTMIQLLAMFFTKLKEISKNETKTELVDVVLSVPCYFVESQKRAILDAAEIAGINCLRLIHDTTAAAIQYGITKFDLPEDKYRNVCIIDMGHTAFTVAVVAFNKAGFVVKSVAFDKNLGGRDFDLALANHFAEEIQKKYNMDVKSNNKAWIRLKAACEKTKKVLSANANSPLNVEAIMNDRDVSSLITRQDFEEMIAPLLNRMDTALTEALTGAGLSIADIESVELVGGSTRVPAVKAKLNTFFNKELSFTLNQDEAIARGCALNCAIISPVFKVRDYSIQDISTYPILLKWEPVPEDPEDKQVELVGKFSPFPTTKLLTFHRKEAFEVEACYPEYSSQSIQNWIGKFTVKNVPSEKDLVPVKVKVKMNLHGLLSFEGAYYSEEVQEKPEESTENAEEKSKSVEENKDANAMDVEQEKKKKVKTIKKDLNMVSGTLSLNKGVINQLRDNELQLAVNDKLIADTEAAKNQLEEYIYEMREKLSDTLVEFVTENESESFGKTLSEYEDWLYNDGEDTTKSVYVKKLTDLKTTGSSFVHRFKEFEDRNKSVKTLTEYIALCVEFCKSEDEKYSHITSEEKEKALKEVTSVSQWLSAEVAKQGAMKKYENPVLLSSTVDAKKQALQSIITPIMNKPKPAPEIKDEPMKEKEEEPKIKDEPMAEKEQ